MVCRVVPRPSFVRAVRDQIGLPIAYVFWQSAFLNSLLRNLASRAVPQNP